MQTARRRRQPLPIFLRRVRKFLKLVRVPHIYRSHNYALAFVAVFLISCLLLLLTRPQSGERGSRPQAADDQVRNVTAKSRKELLTEEAALSKLHICNRKRLENSVEELRFCGEFASASGKKIVGLVEARNVELSVTTFLQALGQVVDSIVIIDDHSTDASRNIILAQNAATPRANGKPLVEVLLNKTGEWVREELFDRELLLSVGRSVGGTHFVLLDYDEYLSANCVENGLLRRTIMALRSGESLYLPWVELWKSPTIQRVLPDDATMNFLTRRQVVIFADDGKSHYSTESATARLLGSHPRNSTLHALRCPRTICPKPAKYGGPSSELGMGENVKQLKQCAIVEARFLNMNNVLLKSAWYEALGRMMGSADGVTSGKMIERLFPHNEVGEGDGSRIRLHAVPQSWLEPYGGIRSGVYDAVETWRAEQLLQWIRARGKSQFNGLHTLAMIDVNALQVALHQVRALNRRMLYHVPRQKRGSFILVQEPVSSNVAARFLHHMGVGEAVLTDVKMRFPNGVRVRKTSDEQQEYEAWRLMVALSVRKAQKASERNAAFFRCDADSEFSVALLGLIRTEFPDLRVTYLDVNWTLGFDRSEIHRRARFYAAEPGSHIQVLQVPLRNFGSFTTLYWLSLRLVGHEVRGGKSLRAFEISLLDFAETLHTEHHQASPTAFTNKFAPVAKLIFSLNFGRSGSKYLADILATTTGIIAAHHEPPCAKWACSGGGALRMQNRSLASSYHERRSIKLPMIRQSVASLVRDSANILSKSQTVECSAITSRASRTADAQEPHISLPIYEVNSRSGCTVHVLKSAVYAETNPNFKSWIYDIVLDFFPGAGYDVRIVVIRKYVAAVLRSLYETGYFTVRDGYNWMETASGVNSKVRLPTLNDDRALDGFERLLSYLVTSEATFRDVLKRYGCKEQNMGARFLEVRAERLYSSEGTMETLKWLGQRSSRDTRAIAGIVRDKYILGGAKKRLKTTLAECEKRVRMFLQKFEDEKDLPMVEDLLAPLGKVDAYYYPP